LYALTKDFYEMYNEIPFDVDDPDLAQIGEVINQKSSYAMINEEYDKQKNVEVFLNNCEVILSNNYNRYNKQAIDSSINAWVNWETYQLAYKKASMYIKSTEVTPQNYKEVINAAQNIINSFNINEDEDSAKDFFDPETHKKNNNVDCFKSGWDSFDLLLNDSGTGVKVGNLVVLVGAPNVGKTIFLGNIGYQYVTQSNNVFFISLEMEEHDMAERVGSNVFDIAMDDYDSYSSEIGGFIMDYKKKIAGNTIPHGKFLLKRMYGASPRDIDNAVRREEKERGIKIHIVVLDYFTELDNDRGLRQDNAFNTYIYHKTNTKDLFDNAGTGKYTIITAHQSSSIDPNSETMDSGDLSESKGILHRPDTVIGIIQSDSMKHDKKYYMKALKTRHSKYKGYVVEFGIDYSHMRLTCGGLEQENMLM